MIDNYFSEYTERGEELQLCVECEVLRTRTTAFDNANVDGDKPDELLVVSSQQRVNVPKITVVLVSIYVP